MSGLLVYILLHQVCIIVFGGGEGVGWGARGGTAWGPEMIRKWHLCNCLIATAHPPEGEEEEDVDKKKEK